MIGKLSFLAGFGAGYVLGARAGRRRYDEMVDMAQRFWRDPRVQEKAEQAQHLAQEKAEQAGHAVKEKAEQAGHAVKDKAGQAGHAVKEKVAGSDDDAGRPGATDPGLGTLP